MSFTPEQSRFTACLLGEGSPAEQAAFDAALLGDAALRAEAVALSRTAHRLEEALRREAARALAGPPRQAGLPRAASPVRRQARAVSWRGPTLATAALLALGLGGLALPWGSPPQVGDSPGGGAGEAGAAACGAGAEGGGAPRFGAFPRGGGGCPRSPPHLAARAGGGGRAGSYGRSPADSGNPPSTSGRGARPKQSARAPARRARGTSATRRFPGQPGSPPALRGDGQEEMVG